MSKQFLSIRWRGRKGYGNIAKNKLLGKAFDAGLYGMVFHWKHNFLPLHFRNLARSRYKYAARSGERGYPVMPRHESKKRKLRKFKNTYTGIKLRTLGHTQPLVGKNQSIKTAALNANRITTSILPNELVASLHVMSRLLNLRGPAGYVKHKGSTPHSSYFDELSEINPQEVTPLAAAFTKSFRTRWARQTKTSTSYKEIK